MKKHYYYPTVVHKTNDERYWAEFPGMPGCFTEGKDTDELMYMVTDAIGLYLEDNIAQDDMPEPMDIESVVVEKDQDDVSACVMLIDFQPEEYLRRISEKSVKKTLTIPSWLNQLATRRGLNFSQILQEGLKIHLGLIDAAEVTE